MTEQETWRIQREGEKKSRHVTAQEYLKYLIGDEQFEAAYVGKETKWQGDYADRLVYSQDELALLIGAHYFVIWTDKHTIIFVEAGNNITPIKVPRSPVTARDLAGPVDVL